MPIQFPDCVSVNIPGKVGIIFPGGIELQAAMQSVTPPTSYEVAMSILGQLNTALAPLQPIFIILDVILAIINFLKVVAGLKLNEIREALKELIVAIAKLLALLPQFSLALLILGAIDTLLTFMRGLVEVLQTWAAAQLRLNAAPRGQYAKLDQVLTCASAYFDSQVQAMSGNLGIVKYLIGLINGFMDVIGLGSYGIPDVLNINSNALQEQVDVLDAAVDFLFELRGYIPV